MALLSAMPQSFLFSGPRRLGKFLVALEFAQSLTNIPPDGAYTEGGDVFVIGRPEQQSADVSKASSTISVEDIREASEFLSRFPSTGRYRVVIIDAADQLTVSAENALLKVLEEPNSTSVIILVTHLPGKLLPTVRSRLFGMAFFPLAADEVRDFFADPNVPDFFYSLGLPGLIATASVAPAIFEKQKTLLRGLFQLSRLTWKERIALAEGIAENPDGISDLLETWLAGLQRQQNEERLRSLAFAEFLEALLETLDRVSLREGNPRLLLERLFTKV
jgi:DNA polymerase III delta prime subunit